MKLHANAALSLNARRRMVTRVLERTCSKWVARYRLDGELGLRDRSSAPKEIPRRTPPDRAEAIASLRRLRMTGAEIAECLKMPLSTVSAVLKRIGLGKLSRLDPIEPPNRYERARPGELLHIDVKKLGVINGGAGHRVTGHRSTQAANRRARRRGGPAGWEFVHICIDDATRLAYAEVLTDEKATTAIAFLRRAVAFYAAHGITTERLLTDNGSAYRSTIHAIACRALGIRHLRTRPYRPRTNGKAERFIKTMIAG